MPTAVGLATGRPPAACGKPIAGWPSPKSSPGHQGGILQHTKAIPIAEPGAKEKGPVSGHKILPDDAPIKPGLMGSTQKSLCFKDLLMDCDFTSEEPL